METPVRRKIKMPNLVGLQADTALLVLKNEGLTGGVIKYEESYETENLVISQSPGRGYILNTHDEIRVTVSQQSYAKYLPGIFQQPDIADSDFLKRFLFIFQHGFNAIESQITEMHQVFRPYDAPEKFLNWLAGWLALPLDDHWSEEKKRTLIKQAMNLYQVRGTVRGLKLFLKIFTDCEPTIIENAWPFEGFRIGVHSSIATDSVILPEPNLDYCFIVELPKQFSDLSDEMVVRIHEIIEREKPAHTTYFLRFEAEQHKHELRPFMQIGVHPESGHTALGASLNSPKAEAHSDSQPASSLKTEN